MKVLVVDDDVDYADLVAALLKQAGHETIVVQHSLEALDVYLEEKPDLVLMDIIMPDQDGIEAAQEILDLDPSARITFMTVLGDFPESMPDELRSKVRLMPKPLRLDRSLFAHICPGLHFPESRN